MKALLLTIPLILSLSLAAAPPTQKEALAEALYTEEVLRDNTGAAAKYNEILDTYRTQRAHAATALFRLAEIRRRQERTEDAIPLYQEFLTHFADLDPQATQARDHLATLGAAAPTAGGGDEESKELARLKALLTTAPDVVTDPKVLNEAVKNNHLRVIDFLLANGSEPWRSNALGNAAGAGYLEAARKLIAHDPDVPPDIASGAAREAYRQQRRILLNDFLKRGFPTEPSNPSLVSLLMMASATNDRAMVDQLLDRGCPVDWLCDTRWEITFMGHGNLQLVASALHTATLNGHVGLALHLLDRGASPDLVGNTRSAKNFQPIHLAARLDHPDAAKLVAALIAKGASHTPETPPFSNGLDLPQFSSTPLEIAIRAQLPEVCAVLLQAGAKPTPYLLKRSVRHLPTFEAMLEGGADPNAMLKDKNHERTIFQWLCLDNGTTDAHLDLMLKHGATIDPNWMIGDVMVNDRLRTRPRLIEAFRKNKDFRYCSAFAIQPLPVPMYVSEPFNLNDPRHTAKGFPALGAGVDIASQNPRIFARQVRGTDLQKLSCYASTPEAAKALADDFLAHMKTWEQAHLKKLKKERSTVNDPHGDLDKFLEKGQLWILHERPVVPTEEAFAK